MHKWLGVVPVSLLLAGFAIGVSAFSGIGDHTVWHESESVSHVSSVAAPSAETIYAVSCSQTDVQAAIDAADDGDAVVVPEGTCTWTTPSSATPSVRISDKAVILQGMGMGRTVIVDGTGPDWNEVPLLIEAVEDKFFRVTGFTFSGTVPQTDYFSTINIRGSSSAYRVDHCEFDGLYSRDIGIQGKLYGVIDHCVSTKVSHNQSIYITDADDSWKRPLSLGTANAVYIEDNTFSWDQDPDHWAGAVDGHDGTRYVFRNNTVTNTHIFYHGPEISGNRSGFSVEIYDNTMVVEGFTAWTQMDIWGGTGVLFNNTILGETMHPILLRNRRSCNPYPVFDLCDGSSAYDGNQEANGYPCLDQIGRSTDAGADTIHPQAHEPLYEWDNTLNGEDVDIDVRAECVTETVHIQENRDYYNDTPRPGYTPYVYPHPLTWELDLRAAPGDGAASLTWDVHAALPPTSTWRIRYQVPDSTIVLVATETLTNTARSYLLTGLTSGQMYSITLDAVLADDTVWLSDTVQVMLLDVYVYLPLVLRDAAAGF